jgi:hypothetical protein
MVRLLQRVSRFPLNVTPAKAGVQLEIKTIQADFASRKLPNG